MNNLVADPITELQLCSYLVLLVLDALGALGGEYGEYAVAFPGGHRKKDPCSAAKPKPYQSGLAEVPYRKMTQNEGCD